MRLKSNPLGLEMEIGNDVKLSDLVKSIAYDAAKREAHLAWRQSKDYCRPIFPNERLGGKYGRS